VGILENAVALEKIGMFDIFGDKKLFHKTFRYEFPVADIIEQDNSKRNHSLGYRIIGFKGSEDIAGMKQFRVGESSVNVRNHMTETKKSIVSFQNRVCSFHDVRTFSLGNGFSLESIEIIHAAMLLNRFFFNKQGLIYTNIVPMTETRSTRRKIKEIRPIIVTPLTISSKNKRWDYILFRVGKTGALSEIATGPQVIVFLAPSPLCAYHYPHLCQK
jgi:hypothetical protein